MRDYWEHWEFLGFRNLFSQRCQSVCRDRKARSSSLCAWPASLEAKQSTTIKSSWSRSNRTAHKSCHYFQVSKILAISIFIKMQHSCSVWNAGQKDNSLPPFWKSYFCLNIQFEKTTTSLLDIWIFAPKLKGFFYLFNFKKVSNNWRIQFRSWIFGPKM